MLVAHVAFHTCDPCHISILCTFKFTLTCFTLVATSTKLHSVHHSHKPMWLMLNVHIWVKTQSKEPLKWVDIPYNCIFICLKDHKGNIIVWIVIISFEIFFINYKVYMLKTWHKSNFESGQSLFFFKRLFFVPNVHHSFWKLKRITLIIKKAKGFELMNF
jgi:hypothetical protein